MNRLTNQEAKEKVIREAWGELWVYIEANSKAKAQAYMFDGFIFSTHLPASVDQSKLEYRHKTDIVRPKNLSGMETNNGWTRIDGPETLPATAGSFTVLGKSGKVESWYYNGNDAFWLEYFTHWRPIEELPLPIY